MENFYTDQHGRIWGKRTIEDSTEVTAANNSLTIMATDSSYELTVPPGTYASFYTKGESELVDAITQEIENNLYPFHVYFGGIHTDEKYNVLVFTHHDGNEITDMAGTFFDNFFERSE